MSCLKTISIQNIQSHRNTHIELHPGVNAIIGPTNAGKSTIIRSIKKVVQNRPSGEAFRSHWGGRSLIELRFTDEEVVGWMKDDKATYYRGDQDYVAFKTEVPEEIQEALNLDKVNLQEQMDLPFMLADSASDVAKVLNKAANLTKIDESISGIRKKLLANTEDIKKAEADFENLSTQKASFQYLDQMEKDVAHYEELTEYANDLGEDIASLANIIDYIKKLKAESDSLDAFLRAEQDLSVALSLTEESKRLAGEIRMVNSLIGTIRTSQREAKEVEIFLQAEPELEKALHLIDKEADLRQDIKALFHLIAHIKSQEDFIKEEEHNIKISEQIFKRDFPDNCPLCGK